MWASLLVSLVFAWSVSGECLVPDIRPPFEECEHWIQPNGQPYYLPHAKNCSRYWECVSNGALCLKTCPACTPIHPQHCPQGLLFFDFSIQFPDGPVCNWATNIDCDGGDRPDYTTYIPSPPTWTPTPTSNPTNHPPTATTQKPTHHPTSQHPTHPPTSQHTTHHPTSQHPTHQPTSQHTTQHPTSQHPTHQPTTTLGDCPGCVCESGDDGWYKPYPGNCHKYFKCTKTSNGWDITVFDCGSWVFDPHQASCTWPELADDHLCN